MCLDVVCVAQIREFAFGLHHHALPALLPLSALGLLWGLLYVASGNLVVSACVHALWNGRIFLTSLLEMAAPV